MAAFEDSIEEDTIAQCKAAAAADIAARLVGYPPCEYRGDTVRRPIFGYDNRPEPTPEQIKRVKESAAYSAVSSLIETAWQQQGSSGGYRAAKLAAQFLEVSGTIYRLRVIKVQHDWQYVKKRKGRASLDKVPSVFPDFISLWWRPAITYHSRGEGVDSMEGVERDDLVSCAKQFYQSGIRCPWFEKMLLEALVCAELYATIKYAKTTPSAWSGRAVFGLTLVCTWAYAKSRGEDPKYTLLVLAGRVALFLVKLAALIGFTWWAWTAYERSNSWTDLLWLIAIGASVVGVVGRWLIRTIVGWARRGPETVLFLQENPLGRALLGLAEMHQIMLAPAISTTVAREVALRSYEKGGGFDQILVAYLDRAVAANEYFWQGRE